MSAPEFFSQPLSLLATARAAPGKSLAAGVASSGFVHACAAVALWGLAAGDLRWFSPPAGRNAPESAAAIELTALHPAEPLPAVEVALAPPPLPDLSAPPAEPAAAALVAARAAVAPAAPMSAAPSAAPDLPPPGVGIAATLPARELFAEGAASSATTPATPPPPAPLPRAAPAPPQLAGAAISQASAASIAARGVQADQAPTAEHAPDPKYPPDLLAAGVEGVVTLELTIAASGAVREARVAASSGHPALDRSALDAVTQWRFKPASRLGLPVEITVLKRVRFVITR